MPHANTMFGGPPVTNSGGSAFSQTQVPLQSASGSVTIDGTPMKVVAIGAAAAIALFLLKISGFKFHVTVGG